MPLRRDPNRQAQCSEKACNNVAVQFTAMLYCKDAFLQPAVFWGRVSECSHRQSARVAKTIANVFVKARRTYVQRGGSTDPPNGAARLVDEWIVFTSQRRPGPPGAAPEAPWEMRYDIWLGRKARGELMDLGQLGVQETRKVGNRANPDMEVGAQSTAALPGSSTRPIEIKQEPATPGRDVSVFDLGPNSSDAAAQSPALLPRSRARPIEIQQEPSTPGRDIPDDVSLLDLGSCRPECFKERPKRTRMDSPSKRSAKRRADRDSRVGAASRSVENQRPTPPLSSPWVSGQRSNGTILFSDPETRLDGSPASTEARVAKCERRILDHNNLILNHDLKIASHEAHLAKHDTEIDSILSRLRSVEGRLRFDRESPARADDDIRKRVDELTGRFNSRDSYIRSEVRRHWKAVDEQVRVNERIDKLSKEITAQETRLEDCQKAVDKKLRTSHKIKKLSARIAQLESKLSDDKIVVLSATPADAGGQAPLDIPWLAAQLSAVCNRLKRLEQTISEENESSDDSGQ